MRPILLFCCALSFAACAKSGEQAGGQPAASLNLADLAGKWTGQALAADKDSVLVTYEMNATATTDGWTMILPGRDPIPLHIMPGGDSLVIHAGPYQSVLHPGVTVSTEYVMRLANGALDGRFVAHYQGVAGPDSVLHGRLRGTRAQ